jgi:hypothetical protein
MKHSIVLLLLCTTALCSKAQIKIATKPDIPIAKDKNAELYASFKNKRTEVWFFENANYGGKKYVLGRGQYTLKELGMDANDFFSSALIPEGFIVMVFEDDNKGGSYYILKQDQEQKKYNADFTKVEVGTGKDVDGRTLTGNKDLNDKISSIVIFNPNLDVVTLYADCDYNGTAVSVYPGPIYTTNHLKGFSATSNQKIWGWLNLADFNIDDQLSSIKLEGQVEEVRIFTEKNLLVSVNNRQTNVFRYSYSCLKNKKYTTDNALYPENSDWNDRASSLTVTMKPGSVTIVN